MRKLIFFDIDGTIITDDGQERIIPDSVTKCLHALHQNNHLCFVNTGRAFAEIDGLIRSLPFDGYVCGCGTYITYQGKVLLANSIPFSLGNELIRDLDHCHLEWVLEGTDAVYYSTLPYTTRIGNFKAEHQKLLPEFSRTISLSETHNLAFDKFCICLNEDSEFEKFYRKYQEALTFIDRGNDFYEVVPKGFSKASGISFLEDYFQIPNKDTIAIGDSTNDLPMFHYAGYSIAMANGSKEIFDYADYITDSVLDNGIYNAMQHLALI